MEVRTSPACRLSSSSPLALSAALALLAVLALPGLATAGVPRPGQQSPESQPSGQLELTLLDAVEHALRHNLQVQVAAFNQDVAEEAVVAARAPFDATISFAVPNQFSRSTSPQASQLGGADVLTQESLSGGASFVERLEWGTAFDVQWLASRFVTNNEFSTFNPRFDSSLSFNVIQPLLRDFGREVNRRGILVAQNDVTVSRERFREQLQDVILQAYAAYWEMAFTQRNLEVAEQTLDLAREQLDRNQRQVRIGTLARIELVQSEQRVADAEFGVVQAEIAMQNARDRLLALINAPAFSDAGWDTQVTLADEPTYEIEEVDLQRAVDTALRHDPGLRQARIDLDSRQIDLSFARNQLLPSLDLLSSVSLSGLGGDRIFRSGFLGGAATEVQEGSFQDALEQLFSGDFRNWSVGVQVSFPLHNWQAEARHAQASVRERQARASIANQEQQVELAVRQAARQLVGGAEAVATARKARELAERQLAAEQRRFELGTTSNFFVLEFQRQLAAARTRELRAVIDFNVAQARLEAAKGTLLDFLGVSIRDAGAARR